MTPKLKFRWWGKMRLEEAFAGELDFGRLDSRGFGPLHWCVSKQDRERFLKVLEFDVDVNLRTSHGQSTPLHFAAEVDDPFYATSLIEAGADIEAKDWHRQTPLHIASETGRIAHVRILVVAGARLKEYDQNKRTPLDLAFKEARMEVIEYLCENADALHRTWSKRLLRAARYHQPDVVKWLLAKGANPLTKDKFGKTAIEIAKSPPYDLELDDVTKAEIQELEGDMQAVIAMLEDAVKQSKSEQAGGHQPPTRPEPS